MSDTTLEITIENKSSQNLTNQGSSAIMKWDSAPPAEIASQSSATLKAITQEAGMRMATILGLYGTDNQSLAINANYNLENAGVPTGLHAFIAGLSGLGVSNSGISVNGNNATGTVRVTDR